MNQDETDDEQWTAVLEEFYQQEAVIIILPSQTLGPESGILLEGESYSSVALIKGTLSHPASIAPVLLSRMVLKNIRHGECFGGKPG